MFNISSYAVPSTPLLIDVPWNMISALTLSLVTLFFYYTHNSTIKAIGIYELPGLSIITAWRFFTKRFDFMRSQFKRTGHALFQFRVSQYRVIAVSGEDGRKVFFDSKSLNFEEGYDVLNGGTPVLEEEAVKAHRTHFTSWFNKHMVALRRKERLDDALPLLFSDLSRRVSSWTSSRVNPFEDIYDLVFQMTVRMSTCAELSQSKEAVTALSKLFKDLEHSATPILLLLPNWFPKFASAKNLQQKATKQLCDTLSGYVDLRRQADVPRSTDAMDYLIAQGSSNQEIVDFVLNFLFAGVINTGMTACWMLLYLCAHPSWKTLAKSEITTLIQTHTNIGQDNIDLIHDRLSTIPVSAWEDEMPVLDAIIRETLRLTQTGTALRRNVLHDIDVSIPRSEDQATIPKGSFLAYCMADVHLDPQLYADPFKFDPGRYEREKNHSVQYPFLGWGAGRHSCTGMRIAKLELKILLAYLLATPESDFELQDASGKFPDPFPAPNRNDLQQIRPIGDLCFLRFRGLQRVANSS